jgi:ADP-heptose:LPS heptosyltransferase
MASREIHHRRGPAARRPAETLARTPRRAPVPARKPTAVLIPHPHAGKRKLILRCWYSLGDITLLTAAIRELHASHPGQFLTDVRTPFDDLWLHNPHITPIADGEGELIECDYALLDESNRAPFHAIHSFTEHLATRLGLRIRPALFKGDIHLHPVEKMWASQVAEHAGVDVPYWVIAAGGKRDITIKWWSTDRWQAVVDHFRGRIVFVQVGGENDHHPPLRGVLDLRGRTTVRELIRLVHHSAGVLCPVTSLMHLAAAVPVREGRPQNRPCVVVAGGREPAQWEAYPHHQFLHTLGALPCCDNGGCWKARTVPLGDGHPRDTSLCVDVVKTGRKRSATAAPVTSHQSPVTASFLPRCMSMITPADVIRAIERYREAGASPALPRAAWNLASPHLTTAQP